jgi:hypothetical protein
VKTSAVASVSNERLVVAHKAGRLVTMPPFPAVHVENTRTSFFEHDEFLALVKHLPVAPAAVATFMYWTGWRRNETLTCECARFSHTPVRSSHRRERLADLEEAAHDDQTTVVHHEHELTVRLPFIVPQRRAENLVSFVTNQPKPKQPALEIAQVAAAGMWWLVKAWRESGDTMFAVFFQTCVGGGVPWKFTRPSRKAPLRPT